MFTDMFTETYTIEQATSDHADALAMLYARHHTTTIDLSTLADAIRTDMMIHGWIVFILMQDHHIITAAWIRKTPNIINFCHYPTFYSRTIPHDDATAQVYQHAERYAQQQGWHPLP